MLDTRQYRDDQACGDEIQADCAERLDSARSITGADQERWLADGLRRSNARWDVLGQQVLFAKHDFTVGSPEGSHMDTWDGYQPNRDRIARALGTARNGVVLTGDVHQHWAAEVMVDGGESMGVELVTTAITSTGDGNDDTNDGVLAENPHIKFYKNRRGYVRTRFTTSELRTDFRVLPYVSNPGAPATTAASFVVEDRDRTLHPA
jgi:alkaline phosphatase D